MPSAKYCWSGSLPRLANGSTTIDRRGATAGCVIEVAAGAVGIGVAAAVAWSAGFPAPEGEIDAGQNHHATQTTTSAAATTVPMMARPRRDGRAGNPGTGGAATPWGRNA